MAEAQYVFTGPKFSDTESDPTSKKLSQGAVYPMHTTYLLQIYQAMKTKIVKLAEEEVVWNKSQSGPRVCFVGIVQLYTDRIEMTLKESSIVAFLVQLVLLCFSKELRRYLINHGYAPVQLDIFQFSDRSYETGKMRLIES